MCICRVARRGHDSAGRAPCLHRPKMLLKRRSPTAPPATSYAGSSLCSRARSYRRTHTAVFLGWQSASGSSGGCARVHYKSSTVSWPWELVHERCYNHCCCHLGAQHCHWLLLSSPYQAGKNHQWLGHESCSQCPVPRT